MRHWQLQGGARPQCRSMTHYISCCRAACDASSRPPCCLHRPPLCTALELDAPDDLVLLLMRLRHAHRLKWGGANEAEPGKLPMAAQAAQAGDLELLNQVGLCCS